MEFKMENAKNIRDNRAEKINDLEYTDVELGAKIDELARDKFGIDLEQKELAKVIAKIKTILDYQQANKSNCDSDELLKKIEPYLIKLGEIKGFIEIYFKAEKLFHQLEPEGLFYSLDRNDPEKLMKYIQQESSIANRTPKKVMGVIIARLKKIKEVLGDQLEKANGKRIFIIRSNEVEEAEINKVTKSGHIVLAHRSGNFSPVLIFGSRGEAKKYLEEGKK